MSFKLLPKGLIYWSKYPRKIEGASTFFYEIGPRCLAVNLAVCGQISLKGSLYLEYFVLNALEVIMRMIVCPNIMFVTFDQSLPPFLCELLN